MLSSSLFNEFCNKIKLINYEERTSYVYQSSQAPLHILLQHAIKLRQPQFARLTNPITVSTRSAMNYPCQPHALIQSFCSTKEVQVLQQRPSHCKHRLKWGFTKSRLSPSVSIWTSRSASGIWNGPSLVLSCCSWKHSLAQHERGAAPRMHLWFCFGSKLNIALPL